MAESQAPLSARQTALLEQLQAAWKVAAVSYLALVHAHQQAGVLGFVVPSAQAHRHKVQQLLGPRGIARWRSLAEQTWLPSPSREPGVRPAPLPAACLTEDLDLPQGAKLSVRQLEARLGQTKAALRVLQFCLGVATADIPPGPGEKVAYERERGALAYLLEQAS